jgi:hypothetical protein
MPPFLQVEDVGVFDYIQRSREWFRSHDDGESPETQTGQCQHWFHRNKDLKKATEKE